MKLFGKSLDKEVGVVAEIGVNHEGDVEIARRLVQQAASAGADAVKFQSYTPRRFISASDPERLERVTRFALSDSAHRELAETAAKAGIAFFSTPITEDVIPLLDELCPAIKIASGDLTFEPVIRAATATGKPVVLSTGGGTIKEVDQAVAWVKDESGQTDVSDCLVLMHCVSAYPTPINEINVRAVPYLAERYALKIGFSNHVIGDEACLAAVALGASLVEVHFTDKKEGRTFRDHELSFEPNDLTELIRKIGRIRSSLGSFEKKPARCEEQAIASMRKGLVAARDLESGTKLTVSDLIYARPASEFAADEIGEVVGCRLIADIGAGETIRRDSVVRE